MWVAQRAKVSLPTIRLIESGKGNLDTFNALLKVLGLQVAGRQLPPGKTLGERVYRLRARKNISQRDIAKTIGVSQPAIVQVERHNAGRLVTLDRMLLVLGAGAYLAHAESRKDFYSHAGNSSTSQTWTTPPGLLQKLYDVFDRFDLDPCSPSRTDTPVRARFHYTEEDDGLALPWFGQVFVNPPYSRALPDWIKKAKAEVEEGRASSVVALVPARTDTRYWHEHVAGHADIVFLKGRLSFGQTQQAAPFPSALVIWGADEPRVDLLATEFPDAWLVRRH